ncbi:MAG: patatin-like phospholipase family protein [Candidatus Omnitrophota bacterium]|nr:MAG: patatin-like phospholipase family protein [Candidatus Omnitrophota bacterium]
MNKYLKHACARTIFTCLVLFLPFYFCLNQPAYAEKSRPKIALVLGGGGARGISHIGVLKALEKHRIPVDFIVGTSIGAVIGAGYATGLSPEELEEIMTTVDWQEIFDDKSSREILSFRTKLDQRKFVDFELGFRDGKFLLPSGIVAGQKLDFILKSMAPVTMETDFDKLNIPFRATATDLETGEFVLLSEGNIAESVRASMAVGGVFSPVMIKERLLVDGAYADHLPVDVALKWGADVIIAVDVGCQLLKRDKLENFVDIVSQTRNIMWSRQIQKSIELLREQDILISPDVCGMSVLAFDKSRGMIKSGEKTAEMFEDKLAKYSLAEDKYRKYLKKQRRAEEDNFIIDFIRITRTKRVPEEAMRSRMETKPGMKFNAKKLEEDLSRIYEIGEFEQINFDIIEENGKKGLLIYGEEKSWGPHYIKFGIQASDNFEGDSVYNLIGQYKITQVNRLGAEWLVEPKLGRKAGVYSEFYQPLDYAERFFITPKFDLLRDIEDIYEGNARTARYRTISILGGIDFGMNISTLSQMRFGYYRGILDAEAFVGDTTLPSFNVNQAGFITGFAYDDFDNDYFPTEGLSCDVDVYISNEGIGADEDYYKLEGSLTQAFSYGGHTFTLNIESGYNLRKEIPFYDEFTLGGPLRLAGYSPNQLRGQNFGVASLLYYYNIASPKSIFVDKIYLGCMLESGNAWISVEHIDVNKLRYSGSGFIGLETFLGPVYVGYALANKTDDWGRIYFVLGRLF